MVVSIALRPTITGGRAAHLTYRLTFTYNGKRITAQTNQYGFLLPGRSEVFTYTTLPASARSYDSVFTASARSIRFSG